MSLSSGREARGRARRSARASGGTQLDLWKDPGGEVRGRPDLAPTRVLLRHPSCTRVLESIRQVRVFFPELDGMCVRVGLTQSAAGFASREEPCIWINPRRLVRHTIAHELVHLLQNRGLVPSGEKAADLFALARHPVLADDLPCYLSVPRSMVERWSERGAEIGSLLHRTARDAVSRREGGERRYLAWFEHELRARWHETRAWERDSRARTVRQESISFGLGSGTDRVFSGNPATQGGPL